MALQKFRWSKVYESAEEELQSMLASKNLSYTHADLEAGAMGNIHVSEQTTIWCAEGSFYLVVNGQRLSMQVGDAIAIPSASAELQAGLAGCSYYLTV